MAFAGRGEICFVEWVYREKKKKKVKTKYSAALHIFTFILPSVYRIVDVLDAEDEMLSPVFVCELFL